MTAAYLDTSFFVAIVLGELGAARLRSVLAAHNRVLTGDLLVARDARSDLAFLSRDAAQRTVAKRLGFPAP